MGLFSKLSENIHHGGVKIALAAPGSASLNDATLDVTVTLTSSEARTFQWVRVDLDATQENFAFNNPGSMNNQDINRQQNTVTTVARAQMMEPFSMAAGETKTIPLQIVLNAANAAAAGGGLSQGQTAVAKVFSKVAALSSLVDPHTYHYSLNATANVDGIALDPSTSSAITINRPGELGTTLNIKL